MVGAACAHVCLIMRFKGEYACIVHHNVVDDCLRSYDETLCSLGCLRPLWPKMTATSFHSLSDGIRLVLLVLMYVLSCGSEEGMHVLFIIT